MNKFEQLIEYVINDEEAKARELFHDIVVEKSRQIYEEMMEEEAVEEAKEEEELEEAKEEEGEEELEEAKHDKEEEEVEESIAQEALGGDQSDDLIDDIEMEEEGMSMEGEGEEDMGGDGELEDRVVDLEDKLDELMAEFEALMGDEGAGGEEMDMDAEVDMDMDTPDMSGEEVADDELETEGMMKMPMEEAVSLKAAPAPVKSEEAGINKKSTVAANSGAKGAMAQPVKMTGDTAQGRPAPGTKELIGKVQNTPAQGSVKQEPATKPHLAQATGVNTKTPFPKA